MSDFKLDPEILKMCCCTEGWVDAFMNAIDYVQSEYLNKFNGDSTYWDIPGLLKQIREDLKDSTNDVGWLSMDFVEHTDCWSTAMPMLASISEPYEIEIPAASVIIYGTSTHDAVFNLVYYMIDGLYELATTEYICDRDYETGVVCNSNEEELIERLKNLYSLGRFMNGMEEIQNQLKYELMRMIVQFGCQDDLKACYSHYPISTTRLSPKLNERENSIEVGKLKVELRAQDFKIYSYIFHNSHCTYEEIKIALNLTVEDDSIKRYITSINKSISNPAVRRFRIKTSNGKQFIEKPSIAEMLDARYGIGRKKRTIHRRGIPD